MCRACTQRWSPCPSLHEGLGVRHMVGTSTTLQQAHSHMRVRSASMEMTTTLVAAHVGMNVTQAGNQGILLQEHSQAHMPSMQK